MNRFFVVSAAALTLSVLTACKTTVVSGGGTGGEGGAGGSSSSSVVPSTSSGPVAGAPQAIVFEEEPGFVTVRITTFGATCDNTSVSPPYEQCAWTEMRIRFPADYLVPGNVDMNDEAVNIFVSESGTPNSPDPNDCPGSGAVGGGAGFGTLAIQSVSDDSVTFILSDIGSLVYIPIDGMYTAPRCD